MESFTHFLHQFKDLEPNVLVLKRGTFSVVRLMGERAPLIVNGSHLELIFSFFDDNRDDSAVQKHQPPPPTPKQK